MHVVVIGAGVIGLSSAVYLARQGLEVSILDRNNMVAQETSFANGGQLSYNYVAPLADPSVFGNLAKWLFKADSPLKFRPRLDPDQWRWCASFLRACTSQRVEQTVREMIKLSSRSRYLLDELLSTSPMNFERKSTGKLIIHRDPASFKQAAKLVSLQNGLGAEQVVMSPADCAELEPTLTSISSSLAGGVFTASEETADCKLFCDELKNLLQTMPNVKFKFSSEVVGFTSGKGKKIAAVRTDNGEIEADAFVIASGIDSVRLARMLNVKLPLYPLRGYSLTVTPEDQGLLPHLSITDAGKKIVYAPLGQRLRIAAMVDMGVGEALDESRIDVLKAQVMETFPALSLSGASVWSGARPATALSKPIIDQAGSWENVFLNVGHGALGFTLACASAEAVAKRVVGYQPEAEHMPFLMAAH